MPSNPAGPPVPPSILRRRGLNRLSAVTVGVGVASVLATGAIAAGLPGSAHNSGAGTGSTGSAPKSGAGSSGTGSGSGSQSRGTGSSSTGSGSGSQSSSGSGSGSSSSILPGATSGGAHATSGAS